MAAFLAHHEDYPHTLGAWLKTRVSESIHGIAELAQLTMAV